MNEKTLTLENINPVDILGVNDKNIEFLKQFFSKIKTQIKFHFSDFFK